MVCCVVMLYGILFVLYFFIILTLAVCVFLPQPQDDSATWISDRANSATARDVTVARRMTSSPSDVNDSDAIQLPVWRSTVDVEAPPGELLDRLRSGGTDCDPEVTSWKTWKRLEPTVDVVEYTVNCPEFNGPRNVCLLRYAY